MKTTAKIILSALGIKIGILNTLLGGIISNLIKIKSNLIKKIAIVLTAFSSIGNFLAFILFDIVDKNIDSYLSFKVIRRMTL